MHRFLIAGTALLATVGPVFAQTAAPDATGTPAPPEEPVPVADQIKTLFDVSQETQKQLDAAKSKLVQPGYGKLVLGGLLQTWVGAGTHPDTAYDKIGGAGFRLRRMEFLANGSIDPRLMYHLNADFTRGTSTQSSIGILQDLYLDYMLTPDSSLFLGQLKIPLSEVGTASSAHLMTIERPLFVLAPSKGFGAATTVSPTLSFPSGGTAGTVKFPGSASVPGIPGTPQWGDIRDIGVHYKYNTDMLTGQVAITQGAGDYQDATDNKYGKQVTGQIFFRPTDIVPGLQLGITGSGGAGYRSSANNDTLDRQRGGGSILYRHDKWTFESEYMAGADGMQVANPVTATTTTTTVGGVVTATTLNIPKASFTTFKSIRHGEYGIIGYDLGGYGAGNGNQIVAQYDYWDPGLNGIGKTVPGAAIIFGMTGAHQTNYTLGLNHDMDPDARGVSHRRLQLNYIHEHFSGGGVAAGAVTDIDEVLLSAQVNW